MKPLFQEVQPTTRPTIRGVEDSLDATQLIMAKTHVPVPTEQITDQQIEQLGERTVTQLSGISNKMLTITLPAFEVSSAHK